MSLRILRAIAFGGEVDGKGTPIPHRPDYLTRFARWLGLRVDKGETIHPNFIAECIHAPFDVNQEARWASDRLQAKGLVEASRPLQSRVLRFMESR
jgi:hypothetical protein